MNSKRTIRLAATLMLVGLAVSGCSAGTPSGTNDSSNEPVQPQTATVLMNYFAQAEQGGYWDAAENQYSKAEGITYKAVPGGPGIQTIPQVASGQYEFGIGNADEVLIARKNGLPVVAVASVYDTNLFVMISHEEANITSFADFNGHQVARRPAPYFDYLKAHFKLNGIQEVNFTGSMATFKLNPNLVQQGFATSDVFHAEQAGIPINVLSVAKDGGYNPYGLVLFTTEKLINENPKLVTAVVHDSIEGWNHFVKDPADAKKAIFASNKESDEATFDASVKTIVSGGYLGSPIGNMQEDRWTQIRDQLASIKLLPADFNVNDVYTTKFLPKQ